MAIKRKGSGGRSKSRSRSSSSRSKSPSRSFASKSSSSSRSAPNPSSKSFSPSASSLHKQMSRPSPTSSSSSTSRPSPSPSVPRRPSPIPPGSSSARVQAPPTRQPHRPMSTAGAATAGAGLGGASSAGHSPAPQQVHNHYYGKTGSSGSGSSSSDRRSSSSGNSGHYSRSPRDSYRPSGIQSQGPAYPSGMMNGHVPRASGGLLSGVAGGIMQGAMFGTGSAIAHRAIDGLMGPRQVEHVHAEQAQPQPQQQQQQQYQPQPDPAMAMNNQSSQAPFTDQPHMHQQSGYGIQSPATDTHLYNASHNNQQDPYRISTRDLQPLSAAEMPNQQKDDPAYYRRMNDEIPQSCQTEGENYRRCLQLNNDDLDVCSPYMQALSRCKKG